MSVHGKQSVQSIILPIQWRAKDNNLPSAAIIIIWTHGLNTKDSMMSMRRLMKEER